MVEEFKSFTEGVLSELDRLKETATLLDYTTMLADVAPRLREWSEKFEGLKGADDETLAQVTEIGKTFDARLKEAFKHQSTLKLTAAPAAGGKRWKMPRKMTRRYCKKTACRKMGFTQKASCRPWKNCY